VGRVSSPSETLLLVSFFFRLARRTEKSGSGSVILGIIVFFSTGFVTAVGWEFSTVGTILSIAAFSV
jgi:hypothetical protein